MNKAEEMWCVTLVYRSGQYTDEYQEALQVIERAARCGETRVVFDYEDEACRKAISALLRQEGFHTVMVGSPTRKLHVSWDQ